MGKSPSKKRKGRPKGPRTVALSVRLSPEQKRDLDALHQILDGKPSINGLIQTAVSQLIERKLSEDVVRQEYEARAAVHLRVIP
jgi:predicted transcriptional regulator